MLLELQSQQNYAHDYKTFEVSGRILVHNIYRLWYPLVDFLQLDAANKQLQESV